MKKTTIRSARWAALLACLAFSVGAQAGSTWNFSASSGTDPATGEPLANLSYASNGVAALTIDGVYAQNAGTAANGSGGSNFVSGAKWNSTATPDSNLLYFGGNGLGMCSGYDVTVSCAQPNHAMDNNGTTEGVLMKFSSSVVLSSIGIGYIGSSGDADISLWRFVGTASIQSPAELNTVGASKAAMEAAGWSLVANYADLALDTSNPYNTVNSGAVGSSWWLVTAYNSSYASGTNVDLNGTGTGKGDGFTSGNDYFKIYAVAGDACVGDTTKCGPKKTPEPSSLALASLAIGGLFYSRRRKTAVVTN